MRIEEAEYLGFSGVWISSNNVRAFVIGAPYPRVIAFETAGHASLLHVSHEYEYFGIRSWFQEPEQTEQSGLPATMPARIEGGEDGALTLRTEKDPVSGLSLRIVVSIDAESQSLNLRHIFRNETTRDREMAPWGIVAVTPSDLIGFTKWRSGSRHTLTVNSLARASDPSLNHGFHTLSVDFSSRPHAEFLKVGTDTDCGWVACANDRTALWVHSEFDRTGHYPEGGGTVTMFRSGEMEGGSLLRLRPLRHCVVSGSARR